MVTTIIGLHTQIVATIRWVSHEDTCVKYIVIIIRSHKSYVITQAYQVEL